MTERNHRKPDTGCENSPIARGTAKLFLPSDGRSLQNLLLQLKCVPDLGSDDLPRERTWKDSMFLPDGKRLKNVGAFLELGERTDHPRSQ